MKPRSAPDLERWASWRFVRIPTVAIFLVLLAGCVVMPMSRTYYAPNPSDGNAIRSASCGWNATALDALQRDIGGMVVSVFPKYETGQPLRVHVLLGNTPKSVDAKYEMIEVRSADGTLSAPPATTKAKTAGPNFFVSIDYVFPSSFDAKEISLVFLDGFIKLDGREVNVAPFRFTRITKSDVYYGSINC